jgi:hypothetical protein
MQVVYTNGTVAIPVYTAEPLAPPAWLARAGTYATNVTYDGSLLRVSARQAVIPPLAKVGPHNRYPTHLPWVRR